MAASTPLSDARLYSMPLRLSVIVPVYNEAQTIEQVLDRVDEIDLGGVDKEVIVVDDGSTDGSAEIIESRMHSGRANRLAHLSIINLGKGAAIRFGFKHATGDIVMIQDADLELDPAECTRLIAPIVAGDALVVYGSRFKAPSAGIPRRTRWANRLRTWLTNLLFGARLTDMETAYKVFRRDVLETISLRCVGFDIEPEITARVLQAGYRIVEIPVAYNPRRKDEGKKITWTDGVDAIYTLLRCRLLPQRGRAAAAPLPSADDRR
jgi:dolichol-phosphate mannosyltransferase